MTMEEFVSKEVAIWGTDYVFDLYDRGYVPTFINGLGWRFMPTTQEVNRFKLIGA